MRAVFTCDYFGGSRTHEPCVRTECGPSRRSDCSGLNYRDALRACGCDTEPVYCIGFAKDGEDLRAKARAIAGEYDVLVLSGGGDMASPACYDPEDYARHSHTLSYTLPERDLVELALLQAFVGADKPVLGICRGMQLINCFFGGTLYAHLGEKAPAHSPAVTGNFLHHHVDILPDTWLYDAGLPFRMRVNSHHHQAVCRVGEGLSIDAWSEDGVAEALHHEQHRVIAVQWHPERVFDFVPPADPLAAFFWLLSM